MHYQSRSLIICMTTFIQKNKSIIFTSIIFNLKSSEIISHNSFLSSVSEMHTESTSQDVYSVFLYMSAVSYNYSWGSITSSYEKTVLLFMTPRDRYFKYFIPHIGHKCWLAWCKNIALSLEADRATSFQSTTETFEMLV